MMLSNSNFLSLAGLLCGFANWNFLCVSLTLNECARPSKNSNGCAGCLLFKQAREISK
jgi:hypothetical protein